MPEMMEPECMMRRTDAPSESSNHMTRKSQDLLAQEVYNMDAWSHSMDDSDSKYDNAVDEDIDNVNKKLEIDHG